MSLKYQLVLWDFDGTLFDTLSHAVGVFNQLADQHGFRPIADPQQVREMTPHQFLEHHRVPIRKVPLLFRSFLTEIRGKLDQIHAYPGIIDTVMDFATADVRQAIVSSNNEQNIRTCLSQHGLLDSFEAVIGYSRMFGKEKPIRETVRAMSVPATDVIYVGDEIRDIEAGRKAGIDVAAVTWGLNSKSLLRSHQPAFLVDEPGELLSVCLAK